MIDPIGQVQEVIADAIKAEPWFSQHGVEIIEQNKADLKFLLDKQIASIRNVVLVVGCDRVTNHNTGLELTITITAVEYVPLNRSVDDFCTAIQAVEAVIDILDGEWWHFDSMSHETPAQRTLQATATFRGMVNRVPEKGDNNGEQ